MKHIKTFEDYKLTNQDLIKRNNRLDELPNLKSYIERKLQINIGNLIAYGTEGIVYVIDDYKVIKITGNLSNNQQPLLNKDIKGIAKVYSSGLLEIPKKYKRNNSKKFPKLMDDYILLDDNVDDINAGIYTKDNFLAYIIMERVDTSKIKKEVEDFTSLFMNILDSEIENLLSKINDKDTIYSIETVIRDSYGLNILFKLCREGIFIDYIKRFIPQDKIFLYESFVNMFRNISEIYQWNDIHPSQFGYNKKGEIVAFDISSKYDSNVKNPFKNDSESDAYNKKYPIQKNILREKFK